mmetsp:Transcript_3624/g.7365  ORF Transcript_3624/g.7365 Transcript_3624/m.7365 type:complete len:264 (-) Transcript_3624:210-1001(-)
MASFPRFSKTWWLSLVVVVSPCVVATAGSPCPRLQQHASAAGAGFESKPRTVTSTCRENHLVSLPKMRGGQSSCRSSPGLASRTAASMCESGSWEPMETGVVDIPEMGTAKIAVCPCPGKRERDVGRDLDQLKEWGAEAVVTLVEDRELEMLRVGDMQGECQKRGMRWFHCPIQDFSAPGRSFEEAWNTQGVGEQVRRILQEGGRVAVHCRGGLGRAGTITSRLLVEMGVCTPKEALVRVRLARPGAVETMDQEQHVLSVRAV